MVIAAAAVLVITAIGTQWVQILTARAILAKVNAQSLILTEVASEAKVIKGHVNSSATESKAEIKALREKIEMMTRTASDIKEAVLLNTEITKKNGEHT